MFLFSKCCRPTVKTNPGQQTMPRDLKMQKSSNETGAWRIQGFELYAKAPIYSGVILGNFEISDTAVCP